MIDQPLSEYVKLNYRLLSQVADEVRLEHPEIGNMRNSHAFQLIADKIGFEFSPADSVKSTLDRAEEFLRNKQQ